MHVLPARCPRDVAAWPEAGVRYEQPRRQRVEAIVALGARASVGKLTDTSIDDSLEWVHGYRVDWATPA